MVRRLSDHNPDTAPLEPVGNEPIPVLVSQPVLHFVRTATALGMDDSHFGALADALAELGPNGLLRRLAPQPPRPVALAQPFRLRDKIDPRLVMTDVRAQTWNDVVTVFCDALSATSAGGNQAEAAESAQHGQVCQDLLTEPVLADLAEHFQKGGESFGWFLGTGVGVPHAFVSGLHLPRVAIVRLQQGLVGLQTPDDVPVRLLFFLLEPLDNAESHLLLLARIAHICGTVGNLGLLLAAAGPDSLLDCISALDYDIRNGQR